MLERVEAIEARNPRGLGRDVCGRGRGGGGSGGRVCGRSLSPSVASSRTADERVVLVVKMVSASAASASVSSRTASAASASAAVAPTSACVPGMIIIVIVFFFEEHFVLPIPFSRNDARTRRRR